MAVYSLLSLVVTRAALLFVKVPQRTYARARARARAHAHALAHAMGTGMQNCCHLIVASYEQGGD